MKLIDNHWKWNKKGILPDKEGLCNAFYYQDFKYAETLELFEPTDDDKDTLELEYTSTRYWGSMEDDEYDYNYNVRRQTIVLFICAMHGEI